jgi:hypothetical protein
VTTERLVRTLVVILLGYIVVTAIFTAVGLIFYFS